MNSVMAPLVSAQKPPNGVSLVSRCPIVLTMRQPPDMVPSPMAAPQATMTHAGTTPASVRCSAGTGKSLRTRCSATSNPTMIPIVFCASLEPCPREYAAAEPSCSTRNTRSTLRGKERRSAHDSATVSASASVRPITGATTMKTRRSEEHTSELQSHHDLVCRLLLEKKKKKKKNTKIQTNKKQRHNRN